MEKNVTEKNPTLQNPRKEKRLRIWDCIWFGHYMQSNASGEKEPIKWRVLNESIFEVKSQDVIVSKCDALPDPLG